MKKALLIFCALLLTLSGTGCSGTAAETDTETAPAATENVQEETVPETDWYGNIPAETNFNGYEFTTIKYDFDGQWDIYLAPEELTGEVLNDAAFQRNAEVEELLNISVCQKIDGDYENTFRKTVLAGEGETFDLLCFWSPGNRSHFITEGLVYDWLALENTDLTAPWYNQTANTAYNIAGKQYFAVSDYTFPVHQHTRILFNKELMTDLSLEYPYEAVHNGDWTFDMMMEYTKNVYADLNGNGEADDADRYGMGLNSVFAGAFITNSGELPVASGSDGFQINLYSDRIVSIVEELQKFRSNQDFYVPSGNEFYTLFTEGRILFETFGSNPSMLRDIEFDFGYLPYPKFDETQKEYIVWSAGGMMALPSTLTDPARTGAIIEALSAGSHRYVKDAFISNYVENKILRDEDSQIIYRMMRDKATYDISYNIDPSGKISNFAYYAVFFNDTTASPASHWGSAGESITTAYDKLFNEIVG